MLVMSMVVHLKSTDQEDKLLFEPNRDLHNKRERNHEHEDVRRDVEGGLNNCIVVQDHAIQWW